MVEKLLGVYGVLVFSEDFKRFDLCAKGFGELGGEVGVVESVGGGGGEVDGFFRVGGVGRELVLVDVFRDAARDFGHDFV